MVHVVDPSATPLEVVPLEPDMAEMTAGEEGGEFLALFASFRPTAEREAKMVERKKHPILLRDVAGTREFHGRRLASTTSALLCSLAPLCSLDHDHLTLDEQ